MIRFGCCLPGGSFMPEGVGEIPKSVYEIMTAGCDAIGKIGYDYAEAAVGLVMNLPEDDFRRAADTGSIRIGAANSFIPGGMRIAALDEKMRGYVDAAMSRLNALGAKILVFGSGASRRYTDGEGYAKGLENMKAFLRLCDKTADKYGLTVAIEPLNSRETNMITKISEGAEMVRGLNAEGCAHIKLLADAYHMSREAYTGGCTAAEGAYNEAAIEDVEKNADIIVHTHAAEPFDRRYPGSHDGEYIGRFIKALNRSGYNGGMSVECGFGDFRTEARAALDFLRRQT